MVEKSILLGVVLILGIGISTLFVGNVVASEAADIEELDGDGTADDPYVITTAEELQATNQDLEAHYVLGNDIDASDSESWNGGAGFEPIGDAESGDRGGEPFSGHLDGNGYTISGLTIDRPGESHVGLFGAITGTVEHLWIDNADVSGHQYTGVVTGSLVGDADTVGVVGQLETTDEYAGGVAGRTRNDASIERAYADVDVTGDGYVGGIIGLGAGSGPFTELHAAGSVEGDETAGGLIGRHYGDGQVRNSYSSAAVDGDAGEGGVFGSLEGTATNVYAAGTVSTTADSSGGVSGWFDNDEPAPSASYWDVESVGESAAIGSGEPHGIGYRTDEMTGSAATANLDLDFDDTWTATDEYPVLLWQVQDVDLRVSQPEIGEGETTDVTVELTLEDGSTVTASEVATYDSEAAVAAVTDGTLEANAVGETELTATVAGETDTTTVTVLEPPNIEFVDAVFDTEAAVEGATVNADATYENTGGPGSETATVTVDGEDVASSSLEIDADGETTESIEWAAETGGTVEIDEETVGDLTIVDPDTVSLESVSLPAEAAAESEYEIDLEFDNEADRAVTDTIELRIGGETVAEERVTVDAGGSTETITHAHDEQGTTTHVVARHDDEETATMELLEPAEFSLAELEVPETVSPGETETVTATVTNTGGGEDTAEMSLTAGEESIEPETVTLESGESAALEFEPTFDEDGEIDIVLESPDDALEETVSVESDDSIPGFGGTVAVVAIALASILALRRR